MIKDKACSYCEIVETCVYFKEMEIIICDRSFLPGGKWKIQEVMARHCIHFKWQEKIKEGEKMENRKAIFSAFYGDEEGWRETCGEEGEGAATR